MFASQAIEKKRIAVSQKRQITIPLDFFINLGIKNEVDCFMQNNQLIIRPTQDNNDNFDEQILSDLISQGFSGNELLSKFKEARQGIQTAVKKIFAEAERVAKGEGEYFTLSDIMEDNA